ncbi:hypothetical protein AXG93_715s1010 [Marchantia polymorpha subsp. ruderalis]|uniref:Endonuclease/exonuclease/phosphatase domain-containing protein n=1 Tax=Marchantia polymorpha subsp. ruderalis TaxID=1480154 RepID=A0A176VHA1_MARPO|nr:hypothetical protein AXG93_715s1010 [Marchantia polymorpha subsp. ruderalis]
MNSKTRPEIIALQEHKVDGFAMTAIGNLLNRDFRVVCAPGQRGARGEGTGGTALLIHKSLRIKASGKTDDGFLVWAMVAKEDQEFYIASVYGPHTPGTRAGHWNAMRNSFPHTNLILCGDWNMVENLADSSGERQALCGSEYGAFMELRSKHNLVDCRDIAAENIGPRHTRWCSYGGTPRWARIDRIYISHAGRWLAAIKHVRHHAGNTLSDHLPISTELEVGTLAGQDGRLSVSGPTTFKWSPALISKEAVKVGICKIWKRLENKKDDPRRIYYKGTAQVRKLLRSKQREQRNRISDISRLHSEIVCLHDNCPGDLSPQQLTRLDWLEAEKRIREHERDVEIRLWSRVKHLGLGDAPSKYFFNIHRQNSARSQILQLKLQSGEETRDPAVILCTIGKFYADLYTARPNDETEAIAKKELMGKLTDKLSAADKLMLSAPPTEKEIEDVLFALPLNKAPGVDGISAEALRKTWPHMKNFYLAMVAKFWEDGVLAETVTEGMIRLIPKSVNKLELKDWRPLTMLNTDYKIIAKILASRLQLLLPTIILPQQTGFVKGRNMLDNVLTLWMAQDAAKSSNRRGMHQVSTESRLRPFARLGPT